MTAQPLGRPAASVGDDSRRRILDSAMRCVAEMGYARATVREIARIAGMTSGNIYYYFPNKVELMTAAITEMVDIAQPRLAAAAATADDTHGQLMAVFDECERLHTDHPYAAVFDRAFRAEYAQHPNRDTTIPTLLTALHAVVIDIIDNAHRHQTLLEGIDVDSATTAILTLIRGVSETPPLAPRNDHQSTVRALRALLAGTLITYNSSPEPLS